MAAAPGRRRRPRTTRPGAPSRRAAKPRPRAHRRASDSDPPRLTQAQYARHRASLGLPGGTREAVRKAVAERRIDLLPGRRIDPAAADRAWAERSLPRVEEPTGEGVQSAGLDLIHHRAQREAVRRQLDEFRLSQALQENVRAADILDAATECSRVAYERLLNLARRLGPVMAACPEPAECTRILEQEIEAAASELARPLELIPGGSGPAAALARPAAAAGGGTIAYPPLPPGAPRVGRIGR